MKYQKEMNLVDVHNASQQLTEEAHTFISEEEQRFHHELHQVGERAVAEHKHILLITGPSASGKTTSAKRIADVLTAKGKKVTRISLDNFYRSASEMPVWEDGFQNYESVECLDIPLFDRIMHELLDQKHTFLPHFDFVNGVREDNAIELFYDESTYLILEGIHALNPELTDVVKNYPSLRMYISVHSNFVADGEVILTARDLRLARRILRDYLYRGTSAAGTLDMWRYVLRGEDLYIRPYRKFADIHIDSTHAYEPYLYHQDLLPLLELVGRNSQDFDYVKRLLNAEPYFFSIVDELIPQNSLIQEFIRPGFLEKNKIQLRR